MRPAAAALLLSVLLSSLSPGHGVLEAYNTNLKCRCMRQTSNRIPIHRIDRIQVLVPGNGCPNTEIIVHMKDKRICLNPTAKWVQILLTYLQSRNLFSTVPAPVMKRGLSVP